MSFAPTTQATQLTQAGVCPASRHGVNRRAPKCCRLRAGPGTQLSTAGRHKRLTDGHRKASGGGRAASPHPCSCGWGTPHQSSATPPLGIHSRRPRSRSLSSWTEDASTMTQQRVTDNPPEFKRRVQEGQCLCLLTRTSSGPATPVSCLDLPDACLEPKESQLDTEDTGGPQLCLMAPWDMDTGS